jgi:hypothetical protein
MNFRGRSKLYIPSTLNIDLILWHTQVIVCVENVKSWFKSLNFRAVLVLPKMAGSTQTHKSMGFS